MTEVVRKGIQDAQVQLQKANEERLLEEVSGLWEVFSSLTYLFLIFCWARTLHFFWILLLFPGLASTDSYGGLCAQLVFPISCLGEGTDF